MPAGQEDRGHALRACSNMRGAASFTVGERRLTHPSVFVLARQRKNSRVSATSKRFNIREDAFEMPDTYGFYVEPTAKDRKYQLSNKINRRASDMKR